MCEKDNTNYILTVLMDYLTKNITSILVTPILPMDWEGNNKFTKLSYYPIR